MTQTDFSQYVLKSIKDTDRYQSHLSFNKGKYNVPDEKYKEFYDRYYKAMIKGEELFLIEKVYNSKFFFALKGLNRKDIMRSSWNQG